MKGLTAPDYSFLPSSWFEAVTVSPSRPYLWERS
jgi:hypothetical protein